MPIDLTFRRGDLVIGVFGGDYGKPRPAVVIQSDLFNESHTSAVLCPLSSEITGHNVFRVRLRVVETPGLRKDCEIMVDKMRAIDRNRIRQRIGNLSASQMNAVNVAMRRWLDLP